MIKKGFTKLFGDKDLYIKLVKNNPLYVVWFAIYFFFSVVMLGGNIFSFLISVILYAVSLSITFSPLGEKLLRFFEKVRPLYTKQEKEYLIPTFEQVYDEVKEKYPELKDVEICIIDNMSVNALAIGKRTVAVTKGAVETFSEEELKAILAHELAHIINGDTIATLLTTIGNGIFTVFVIVLKWLLLFIDSMQSEKGAGKLITTLTKAFFTLFIFLFMLVGNIIISINSRKSEFRADEFSYTTGHGENMVEALYLLQKISLSDNSSTIDRITASHPHIAKRIGKLEEIIDGDIYSF